ncbi:MAG: hypothetical protein M3340_09135 [Actinomycetota bacterium]|nr:hypothetical protein [Actinomycetota bacterium]
MRARLRQESGVAMVVAVMITGLMLGAGVALLSLTDYQTSQTGKERVRESALTLAEGALNAQANLLSAAWPETSDQAFAPCTQTSSSVECPNVDTLLRGFGNDDFDDSTAVSWHLSVRDNQLGAFYEDSATASQPAWDANGPEGSGPDGIMWLRAQATVKGERRTIVSLVRATPIGMTFPRGVITAGHFHTTNNGNKVLVETTGGPGVLGRCTTGPAGPMRGDACLDYEVTKGQVWPNYVDTNPNLPPALEEDDISSLRNRAKAAGSWYASCPGTLPTGRLVFIESGNCAYSTSTVYNSRANPGLVVVYNGTLTLAGGTIFNGLVYAPNKQGSSGTVVTVTGEAQVYGAIVVDGAGGLYVGGSKLSVIYDPNVFNLVTTTQTINVIANSWRELNQRS